MKLEAVRDAGFSQIMLLARDLTGHPEGVDAAVALVKASGLRVTGFQVLSRADAPNLGLGIDSFHIFATKTSLEALDELDPDKIFLVQLADFMWQEIRSVEERISTARTFRVFPGEGVHSEQLAEIVTRLDRLGYQGDYSFEVFNDDYQQMPPEKVAERGFRAAQWLGEDVLKRSIPLPGQMRLRAERATERPRES